jgi:hypothetical protein
MEIFVLIGMLALLMFGPRRGGRWPSRAAMIGGGLLFIWLVIALGTGWTLRSIIGPVAQP